MVDSSDQRLFVAATRNASIKTLALRTTGRKPAFIRPGRHDVDSPRWCVVQKQAVRSLGRMAGCSISRFTESNEQLWCWYSVEPWTLNARIETAEQRTIVQEYGDWYTGRWWVGCYIWYSDEGTGRDRNPPSPFLAVPNVTAQPSAVSVVYQLHIIRCGI